MRPAASTPFTTLLLAACAGTLLVSPVPASSQEAIATAARAPDGGAPVSPAASDRPLRIDDGVDDGPGFLRPRGPCGGPARTADGKTDKTPHGEVWAGVGTRGYRELGGAVCMPVGDHTAVSIAIDAGRIDGRGGRRR